MKIYILLLFISQLLLANSILDEIDSKLFYPQDYINKQVCYEVFSPEIMEIANVKDVFLGEEKLIVQSCYKEGNLESRYKYDKIKKNENMNLIFESLTNKVEFVFPKKFKDLYKDFEITTTKNEIKIVSPEEVNFNELIILLDKNKKIEKIIIKKAIGTIVLKPQWIKYKWTKNKFVLSKMEIDRREGVQNIQSEIFINYHNFLTFGLPSKITYFTNQNILIDQEGKSESKKNKSTFYIESIKMM